MTFYFQAATLLYLASVFDLATAEDPTSKPIAVGSCGGRVKPSQRRRLSEEFEAAMELAHGGKPRGRKVTVS